MFGFTCMPLCIRFQRISRTADRGCQPAPGLPCALGDFEGGKCKVQQASGTMCRET
ncbi:hypothetical protein JQ607_06025 [Bradyrhizobium liaoningense]|uniref:hypothetical protein n=1 Tax=Bradyrhizobium liaoningense TaxID=43992 RepID=UPI001BA804C7|nr:hypothetical protein [Bradyrhizobium liaoningense]MBR0839749.1 hypothetical protein [Bradyrhizobium liaoningense]MBR0855982.1 hypothetical protein [Bradyrhizobium liaoningense]